MSNTDEIKTMKSFLGLLSCHTLPDGDYSHPSDQTKFIKCAHGIEYIFNCPNGLVFNFLKRQCDWTAVFHFSLPLQTTRPNLKIRLLSRQMFVCKEVILAFTQMLLKHGVSRKRQGEPQEQLLFVFLRDCFSKLVV